MGILCLIIATRGILCLVRFILGHGHGAFVLKGY